MKDQDIQHRQEQNLQQQLEHQQQDHQLAIKTRDYSIGNDKNKTYNRS